MENARYSGRGGGRGGLCSSGRGRGRCSAWRGGRGGGSWVRVREDDTSSTATSETGSDESPKPSSATSSQPALQGRGLAVIGPGRFNERGSMPGRGRGRGRGRAIHNSFAQPNNKWRRDASGDKSREAKQGEISENPQRSNINSVPVSSGSETQMVPGETEKDSIAPELKKIGNYKLVLPREYIQPSSTVWMESNFCTEDSDEDIQEAARCQRKSILPGNNKLLFGKDPNNLLSNSDGVDCGESSIELKSTNSGRVMVAKGTNKLILTKTFSVESSDSRIGQTINNSFSRKRENQNGKRQVSSTNMLTIKRVKIFSNEVTVKDQKRRIDLAMEETGKEPKIDVLTDFAYLETAPSRPNRNRFFSIRRERDIGAPIGKNMGLVRLNPEESQAPICPVFLRGERCDDERCTKRHDVPRESAMPVCSFFQRHGQCLKGVDCPFRHVKVNPLAMLCPSFNVQGFCNDDQCIMKHVAPTARNNNRK